jgi:hypothetical protein
MGQQKPCRQAKEVGERGGGGGVGGNTDSYLPSRHVQVLLYFVLHQTFGLLL